MALERSNDTHNMSLCQQEHEREDSGLTFKPRSAQGRGQQTKPRLSRFLTFHDRGDWIWILQGSATCLM